MGQVFAQACCYVCVVSPSSKLQSLSLLPRCRHTHAHAQTQRIQRSLTTSLRAHHKRLPFLCGPSSLTLPVGQIISLDPVPLHICYLLNDASYLMGHSGRASDRFYYPSSHRVTKPRRAAAAFACCYCSFSFSSTANLIPTLQQSHRHSSTTVSLLYWL